MGCNNFKENVLFFLILLVIVSNSLVIDAILYNEFTNYSYCSDSDGYNNFETSGFVGVSFMTTPEDPWDIDHKSDFCTMNGVGTSECLLGGCVAMDYYCKPSGVFYNYKTSGKFCDQKGYLCREGACIRIHCTDLIDGGKEYYIRGITNGMFYYNETTGGNVSGIETCLDDRNVTVEAGLYLGETFCENDEVKTEVYRCPNGCVEGRCIDLGNVTLSKGPNDPASHNLDISNLNFTSDMHHVLNSFNVKVSNTEDVQIVMLFSTQNPKPGWYYEFIIDNNKNGKYDTGDEIVWHMTMNPMGNIIFPANIQWSTIGHGLSENFLITVNLALSNFSVGENFTINLKGLVAGGMTNELPITASLPESEWMVKTITIVNGSSIVADTGNQEDSDNLQSDAQQGTDSNSKVTQNASNQNNSQESAIESEDEKNTLFNSSWFFPVVGAIVVVVIVSIVFLVKFYKKPKTSIIKKK